MDKFREKMYQKIILQYELILESYSPNDKRFKTFEDAEDARRCYKAKINAYVDILNFYNEVYKND